MGNSRKKHGIQQTRRKRQHTMAGMGGAQPSVCNEQEISSGHLVSGMPYQRPVESKVVDRLVREWDERLFDPVVVSFRDGRFHLIDGQHRVAAKRKMNGGKDVMVPCKVYYGLTYEQEAELCYKLDKAKKVLSLSQSTNALVESGTDPETMEIVKIVEGSGFVWAFGKRQGKNGGIVATRAVISAYRLLGAKEFARMLALLHDTWSGDPNSLSAALISGMALFVKTYSTEFKDSYFVKRLAKFDPEEICRRGRADFSTNRTALRYARVILDKYNGKCGGKKLEYRFKG